MPQEHEYLREGQPVNGWGLFREVEQIFTHLANPELPDETFLDFLNQVDAAPEVRGMALNYVQGFNAARADVIGTRSLAFESRAQDAIGGDQAFRFPEGYDRLPHWLWSQCHSNAELRLGTVVEKIEWCRGQVSVTARSLSGAKEVISAPRIIITLPLAILELPEAEHGVQLNPRPAGLDQALERLEMGDAVRVTFLLSLSFWQDHQPLGEAGFIHTDEAAFPTWWTTLPGPSRGLTAWAGGPRAERVSALTDERIADEAVESLAGILKMSRETVASEIESWHLHNWRRDPFARGAYSYARVGGLEAREQLAQPFDDTLYFAGEATDTEGHNATVHGAIASGLRAAHQILQNS
jgi:monoamine oxidase